MGPPEIYVSVLPLRSDSVGERVHLHADGYRHRPPQGDTEPFAGAFVQARVENYHRHHLADCAAVRDADQLRTASG